ncbi:uncharacterized protein VTP21DRAFT_5818 [Calcarisporiella thermophila]|uniref:uncharacterized protein n=1 Tax=Calcarisporiella thermophila TaxID=911321 RepID=UPI0037444C4E
MTSLSHASIRDGWFFEANDMWPGQANAFRVKRILHLEQTKYQEILVIETSHHGNALVLDNIVQCVERDEFSYQEIIAHLPLHSHACPKRVLVIGGGDGGVIREVVKHECVEEVVQCEIDEAVIRVSKQYLPSMSVAFAHPKVRIHIGDGIAFLRENPNSFDVIISDSSDPIGPAEALYSAEFFHLMKGALRGDDGVACSLAETMWISVGAVKELVERVGSVFESVAYARCAVPSYPSGEIGFVVMSTRSGKDFARPVRRWSKQEEKRLCKYYNARIHKGAFILPQMLLNELEDVLKGENKEEDEE